MKAETTLFRVRYDSDDTSEKEEFLNSRDFDWIAVSLLSASFIVRTETSTHRWTKKRRQHSAKNCKPHLREKPTGLLEKSTTK